LSINVFFGLVFGVLVLHLNVWGEDPQSHTYLRRNPMFSCKDDHSNWTQWEFSAPTGHCIESVSFVCLTPYIYCSFTTFHEEEWMGSNWTVRATFPLFQSAEWYAEDR
jgi:hypothetical protein